MAPTHIRKECDPENNDLLLVECVETDVKLGGNGRVRAKDWKNWRVEKNWNLLSRDKVKRSQFVLLLSTLIKHFPLYSCMDFVKQKFALSACHRDSLTFGRNFFVLSWHHHKFIQCSWMLVFRCFQCCITNFMVLFVSYFFLTLPPLATTLSICILFSRILNIFIYTIFLLLLMLSTFSTVAWRFDALKRMTIKSKWRWSHQACVLRYTHTHVQPSLLCFHSHFLSVSLSLSV